MSQETAETNVEPCAIYDNDQIEEQEDNHTQQVNDKVQTTTANGEPPSEDKEDNRSQQLNNELQVKSGVSYEVFHFLKSLLETIVEKQDDDSHVILSSIDTQIYLALHFLTTGEYDREIQGISQESVNNYIMNLTNCLIRIAPQFIKFPADESFKEEFYGLGKNEEGIGFPNVLGIIDNTHILLKEPNEYPEIYLDSHNQHCICIQIVCGPDLQIYNVLAAFPGGYENLFIWENSNLRRMLAECDNLADSWLLGGLKYPQEPWLMIPLVHPKSPCEELYNKIHHVTSKPIKKCIEMLKLRFRCLQLQLNFNPSEVYAIATACCVLHNICIYYKDLIEMDINFEETESNSDVVPGDSEGIDAREKLIENYFNCS